MDRRKTAIVGAVFIVTLLAGVYAWSALTAEEVKPIPNQLEVPDVDVSGLSNTVVVNRTPYSQHNLNLMAGDGSQGDGFAITLIVRVLSYTYVPGVGGGEADFIQVKPSAIVQGGNTGGYTIRYLWLGVSRDRVPGKVGDACAAVILLDLKGINAGIVKDGRTVSSGETGYAYIKCVPVRDSDTVGIGWYIVVWFLYDDANSTDVQNHTLTVKATLTYGKKWIFGWYDEHTLTTEVVIKLVKA